MKGLLNTIYNHDLNSGILASDRTSLTRQFACFILERKAEDAFNLCGGNYNIGILVEIAERALANDEVCCRADAGRDHGSKIKNFDLRDQSR